MAINVKQLELSHIMAGATRQKIHNLTDTPQGPTYAQREAFATRHGERNVTKYWSFETVLAALDLWRIHPLTTQTGDRFIDDHGGITFSGAEERVLTGGQEVLNARRTEILTKVEPQHEERKTEVIVASSEEERERKRKALADLIDRRIEAARGKDDEAIKELIASVSQAAAGAVLDTKGGSLLRKMEEQGQALLEEALDRLDKARPVYHEWRTPEGEKVFSTADHLHEKFADILDLARARMNIALIGPTGCGKTHISGQLAAVLGQQYGWTLDDGFGVQSCTMGMSETKLVGGLLPTGDYGKFEPFIADFIRIFRDGGVFLLDEWDATDMNVALIVNTMLDNGYIDLPMQGRIHRHENFVCIAALNTHGTGANRMYIGRSKLDEATLDRFRIGQVEMDYDRALEEKLYGGDRELLEACWKVRDHIDSHRLQRNMSTRFIKNGLTMRSVGWSVEKILTTFVSGWPADEVQKVGLSHLR